MNKKRTEAVAALQDQSLLGAFRLEFPYCTEIHNIVRATLNELLSISKVKALTELRNDKIVAIYLFHTGKNSGGNGVRKLTQRSI